MGIQGRLVSAGTPEVHVILNTSILSTEAASNLPRLFRMFEQTRLAGKACWQQLKILVIDSRTLTGINRPDRSQIAAAREAPTVCKDLTRACNGPFVQF
jgi:hypothetical protein